jgi:putative intracellular protease/amidase
MYDVLVCRAEELAAPYYIFKDAGAHVDVVSIKGGPIPIGRLSFLFWDLIYLIHC